MKFDIDAYLNDLIDHDDFLQEVERNTQNRPQLEDERILDGSTRRGME